MNTKTITITILFLMILFLTGCTQRETIVIQQQTIGANQNITILKDANLITLDKTYCNITIQDGLITNTTC